jgi:hypothetical protein
VPEFGGVPAKVALNSFLEMLHYFFRGERHPGKEVFEKEGKL